MPPVRAQVAGICGQLSRLQILLPTLREAGVQMTRGTKMRYFRADDDLWTTAQSIAAEHGENLSDIIRQALRDYIAREVPALESPGTVKF